MSFALFYNGLQFIFRRRDAPHAQQFYSFLHCQTFHNILFQIRGWINTSSLWERTTCEQQTTFTWLAIECIEPFSNSLPTCRRLLCLQIE
ncbi:MAG: hypothetical protein AUI36_41550 [Cyanobacteria bacterium 13_1_40CM_2_61_4]|nr:MAG: hypothetical protein AUI36_41550 [Cyanobacteria bacterium 13_1_40CM_2_61_4]